MSDLEIPKTDTINPGELIRWREGAKYFVGYLAGRDSMSSNCVEADGTTHPSIPNVDVTRR